MNCYQSFFTLHILSIGLRLIRIKITTPIIAARTSSTIPSAAPITPLDDMLEELRLSSIALHNDSENIYINNC